MYMIKNSRIIKGSLAFALVSGVIVCSGLTSEHSYAKENNVMHASANSSGEIVKLNDNTARIDLKKVLIIVLTKWSGNTKRCKDW